MRPPDSFTGLRMTLVVLALILGCSRPSAQMSPDGGSGRGDDAPHFVSALTEAAIERTRHRVRYDGSYRSIPYPEGDVPNHIGVCTDLVIRAYRSMGIDLQLLVHEDMTTAFSAYPDRWGLTRPDPNIDHRRVPNLEVFFRRHGESLPITDRGGDYRPGDLVTWMIGPLPHIGIVVPIQSADGRRFKIVHNIGAGPEIEDMLFDYPIVGHFRYRGPVARLD